MKNLYSTLFVTILALVLIQTSASAQQELVFKNSTKISGTDKADAAVYKFSNVGTSLDAIVTINGRSSTKVTLSTFDYTSSGFDKAFQPQIDYSGTGAWWMEFGIKFVKHTSGNSIGADTTLSNFNVTALDIDGDGSSFKETDGFYSPASYQTEANTKLSISNLVVSGSTVGKTFTGSSTTYGGIDTTQTNVMVTLSYVSKNSITVRFGGNSSPDDARLYSIWFKSFTYNAPNIILPVKLVSFDATLNKNKVDLKWTTATEQNASHFIVQRSTDGTNFSDAGVVFAVGNSSQKVNYTFSDDITNVQSSVIYYRLCSVDNDGKFDYSEVRVIRISKQTDNTVSIITYPNPVSSDLRITIPATWQNKKVSFEVFNAAGQLSKKSENGSSSQTETINVSELSRGMYVIRVTCNGETAQQKIIKN